MVSASYKKQRTAAPAAAAVAAAAAHAETKVNLGSAHKVVPHAAIVTNVRHSTAVRSPDSVQKQLSVKLHRSKARYGT